MRAICCAIGLACLGMVVAASAQAPGSPRRPLRPEEFGNVVMDSHAAQGPGAVLFSHWLHRTRYTCRLCHVDLGFAMAANQTGVMEADLRSGAYCGACHDGRTAFAAETTRPGSTTQKNCDRCHSVGKDVVPEHPFRKVVESLPKSRFGNRVDWLAAESRGLVHLQDYIEGVSIRRPALPERADFSIAPQVVEIPKIVFSHEKHAVWNGCELCHPQLFGVRRNASGIRMQEIFAGKYCGACHGKVAFPTLDCQLCHTQPVAAPAS